MPDERNPRAGFQGLESMSAKSSRVWKVVVVIAVLMVGGVAWRMRWVHDQNHRKDEAKSHIRMLEMVVGAYNKYYGKNPLSFQDIEDFLKGGQGLETPWHGKYFYRPTSTNVGFAYEIWCVAPDGTTIGNWMLK
jgi:hypothetical protein